MAGHNQLACALVNQVPLICGAFCKHSLCKGCGDLIGGLLGHKAINAAGIGTYARAVKLQGFISITAIRGNFQSNRVAYAVRSLVGSNFTVGCAGNGNFDKRTGISCHNGHFYHIAAACRVAIMLQTHRHNLVAGGDTFHGIGVQNCAVDANSQDISCGTLNLKGCTVAVDQTGCCGVLGINPGPAIPAGCCAICAKAAIGIADSGIVDNTEGIEFAVVHSNTQNYGIAAFSAFFSALRHRKIVLGRYANRLEFTRNILPLGKGAGVGHCFHTLCRCAGSDCHCHQQ